MAQLHIVSKSPFNDQALERALPLISAEDTLLLIDDGVYAASKNNPFIAQLQNTQCYALTDDMALRGVTMDKAITALDMSGFVDLSFDAHNIISWY